MIRDNRKRPPADSRTGFPRLTRHVAALVVVVGLCLVWVLEGTGVPHYWRITQELGKTKDDIRSLEQANAVLRRHIRLADSDPLTLERAARALGYVRAGETIYQFPEAP